MQTSTVQQGFTCSATESRARLRERPAYAMGQLAVVLLALFAQMERTYTCERAAHARVVAAAHGRQVGPPDLLDPAVLAYAEHLRDAAHSMAQIVAKTGTTRSSLYRYLPPRPPVAVTAAQRAEGVTVAPAGTATATAAVVGAS